MKYHTYEGGTIMNTNVQEAVKRSIQTEKNASDFYRLGAQKMNIPDARRTFELLAREEREHAAQFYKIYQGTDIPSLDAFLDSPPDNESSWVSTIARLISADFNEQKALELAMEREKNLEVALLETASKIDAPEIRAVYELNARETHHHFELIESEYARLMGMVHETDIDTFVRE
ncbi:MAG: ferritin family protein [Desulfuromonadaceae bacterium]